jgi:outer membrane receptor for ferrienterochelin and colicins
VRYGEDITLYRGEALSRWQWRGLRPGLRAFTQASATWHHQNAAYGQHPYLGIQADFSLQHGWQKTVGRAVLEGGPSLRFLRYTDNTPTRRIETTPGLYAQAQIPIGAFWVQPGLRVDATPAHGVQASPRLHVRYNTGAGFILRASGGRGYRAVNVITEDHAALSGARRVVVPASLLPEVAYTSQAELSFDTTLGALRLGLAATGWYNYFQHKILPDYDTDPNTIYYRNTQEHAVNQGVSVQATASQGPWTMRASGTAISYKRQQTTPSSGQAATRVLYAPRWQAQAEATYRGPHFGATLRALGTGSMALPLQPSDNRPSQSKPYGLLSAQVSYAITHHITLLAQANNIGNWQPQYTPLWRPQDPFDKTATATSGTFDTAYVYGPLGGRTFVLGINITL